MEDMPIYEYYARHVSTEHMLYSKEIAELYNIKTHSNNAASLFVSRLLLEYTNEIKNYKQFYYNSKINGMCKVYPKNVYVPILENFILQMEKEDKINKPITVSIKKRKFNIIIKR